MKLTRKIIRLFFATMVGLAIGTCFSFTWYAKSYKPYSWSTPPILANCYGKDLPEAKLQSAVDFWIEYGNHIAFILQDPPDSVCKHDFLNGFIILKKAPMNSLNALARTETKYTYLKITSVVIYFEPGTYNLQWLTEHEIGHAFGYKHIDEIGNVMHPFVEFQGGKYWIPKGG